MAGRHRFSIARAGAALLHVRWFVRGPIWLFRAGLGVVFGGRLLMLEHTGRTSGLRRYVVLEVVDRPSPRTYVVVSGFGSRAQWLRNVDAESHVRVRVGSRRSAPAVARRLDGDAAAASLTRYARAHPRSWAKLRPVLEETLGTRIDERGTDLPMIALDLAQP